MKTLYQNFSGIDARFVWEETPKGTAESVKTSLEKLRTTVKDKSIADLNSLKADTENVKVLNEASAELNAYRKALLNGQSVPPTLKESEVQNIVDSTFSSAIDKAELKKTLGLTDVITDEDDVLDLDELAETQRLVSGNIMQIIYEIAETPSENVPELQKLQTALNNALQKISNDITKEKTGKITPETLYKNLSLTLGTEGFDVGQMLEEFANLAKESTANNSEDIDLAMQELLQKYNKEEYENHPEDKESASKMEDIYLANRELASFLAEYYPPGDFERDISAYKTSKGLQRDININDLPDLFLNTKLGLNSTETLGESFREIDFENLKERIELEYSNKALGANPWAEHITDPLKAFGGKMKSNIPPVLKGLKLVPQDFVGVTSVEELFKNKMEVLLGINNGHNHTDKAGRKTINFEGVKLLTAKLDINNKAHIEMISRLEMGIPIKYEGEIGDKYRKALLDGQTRKDFDAWLDSPSEETGVKAFDKMGAWFTNIRYWLLKIGALFGWDGAEEKLEKMEKEREKKSPLHNKIQDSVEKNKTIKEENDTKALWEKSENSALKIELQKFHQNYSDRINFGEFDELLGKVKPDDFKKWQTEESKKLLEWGKTSVPTSKISLKNWQYLIENNAKVETKKDKNGKPILDKHKKEIKIIKVTKTDAPDREISAWTDELIKKSKQPSDREKAFQDRREIFDDSVTSINFMEKKNELFENPGDPESGALKEPFASLFGLDKKFYSEKLSYEDLSTLINNSDKIRGSVKKETMDNRYWTVENGKAKKVKKDEEVATFEVDIKGEREWFRFDVNQDFDSMKALVERLKLNN